MRKKLIGRRRVSVGGFIGSPVPKKRELL